MRLLTSLISLTITHTVPKLLTPTHANILCSHLHLQSADTDRRSVVYCVRSCSQQVPSHVISCKFSDKTLESENCSVPVHCSDHSPVLVDRLLDWQLESLKSSADTLLLSVRNRSEPHTPQYLLFALPSVFFSPRSTICPPPYNVSALNYWRVWSPTRLRRCRVAVHQQQCSFSFLNSWTKRKHFFKIQIPQ